MSADNWTICPKCVEKFPVSSDEELETFREDWEIGTDMEANPPEFYVIYKGMCAKCAYTFRYQHTEALS